MRNRPIGIHTGFADLDYQWDGGLKKGDTYLIAAGRAMGKTSFILNVMLNMVIKEEMKVAFFSLEHPKESIVNRIHEMDSRVKDYYLEKCDLEATKFERVILSGGNGANSRLIINDTPGISVEALDRELSSEAMEGVGVVFVDYLQLMTVEFVLNNRQLEVKYICERLKQIAVMHNVAVIVVGFLSRNVENRINHRPLISDFKFNIDYFDNVSFIYRDEIYNKETEYKGIAEIITAKNKYGSRGVTKLRWLPEHYLFCDIEKVD